MTSLHFILASLRHYRRIHVAVGLGVAVATAVLTGALLVGDSVRGSLRDLTLERLGRIDEVLVAGPMLRAALTDELAADATFRQHYTAAEPAIVTSGTLQVGSGEKVHRATKLSILGCQKSFWSLGKGGPSKSLNGDEIAITENVAQELDAKVGDSILLRVPAADALPSDSALGKKKIDKTTKNRRFEVVSILPPNGLARFGLQPSQHLPRNVFLPIESLQDLLAQRGKANAILVSSGAIDSPPAESASEALQAALRPRLADYGLRLERFESPAKYDRLSSDQLVLRNEVVDAAKRALDGVTSQPVVTYLANTLAVGEGDDRRKIPYSTICGVDSVTGIGPLLDEAGKPIVIDKERRDDELPEIALNRWAADELGAEIGDRVTVTYYEPESAHGKLVEHDPPPAFTLKAIVELKTPNGKPTPAADPRLAPELPGVTDQASIHDWEMPFDLVEKIRDADEKYWNEYSTTPKAFVSLATAKKLWGSRWGTISMLRVPGGEASSTHDELEKRIESAMQPADLGMVFQPIKRKGLAAANGTTPFDGLFLGFSFFLIAAAVMLIALLFQLGVAQRADELGILAASGVARKQITRLLVREGLVVAMLGAALGVVGGVFYAWLMITGLRTWWVAAVATPFLELHVEPRSHLALGWLIGVVVSWLTIRWSVRLLVRLPAARLLAGQTEEQGAGSGDEGTGQRLGLGRIMRLPSWATIRIALLVLLVALCVGGFWLRDEAQAGMFFGSGATALALLLGEIRHRLRSAGREHSIRGGLTLPAFAGRNISRHAGRSALTIGLVASASFLIIAMSAFRLETSDAGTGGFTLLATSDQPIHYDLNTADGRQIQSGQFSETDEKRLATYRIFSLRMKTGEDASCLNLYKPTQPTVLGVPDALIERGGFEWANQRVPSSLELSTERPGVVHRTTTQSPWTQLWRTDLGQDENGRPIIPVALDANTAMYSLQIGGVGARLTIADEADRPMTLEVVGLLKNSIWQGRLLVSEKWFQQLYPETSGYRFFLIDRMPGVDAGPPADDNAVAELLETRLAEEGFDATPARDQLAEFLAVQNTYLSTFQSLGALGLLLGTIGLAVVQLRSVLERRGELALMRASGFRRGRLVWMVFWENAVLLLGGLGVGCVAAGVALIPQWGPQAANVPWLTLLVLLAIIAAVGLAAGWLATRSALRAPIVAALRGD